MPEDRDPDRGRLAGRVLALEDIIRKIGFPLAGLAGLVYTALTGETDSLLMAAYVALLGYGGLPWVRDAVKREEK